MTERFWQALREVDDPEMPVNLVDLGVIYDIKESQGTVEVDLTFTAMGCPASDFILDDVRDRLMREPGVREVVHGGSQTTLTRTSCTPGSRISRSRTSPRMNSDAGQPMAVNVRSTSTTPCSSRIP